MSFNKKSISQLECILIFISWKLCVILRSRVLRVVCPHYIIGDSPCNYSVAIRVDMVMLGSLCAETEKPVSEGDRIWQLWKEMNQFIKWILYYNIILRAQQIRAMNACFGLTQGGLQSEYNTPFFSFLCVLFFFSSNWLASDVLGDKYHEVFVQKIPFLYDSAISSFAVAQWRYCQEYPYYSVSSVNSWRTRRDDNFNKTPIFHYTVINLLLAHTMYWPATTSVASPILQTTPTYKSASTLRLWGWIISME